MTLKADVHDPKVLAAQHRIQRVAKRVIGAATSQPTDAVGNADDDVNRKATLQRRALVMGLALAARSTLPTRARPLPTMTARKLQRLLLVCSPPPPPPLTHGCTVTRSRLARNLISRIF